MRTFRFYFHVRFIIPILVASFFFFFMEKIVFLRLFLSTIINSYFHNDSQALVYFSICPLESFILHYQVVFITRFFLYFITCVLFFAHVQYDNNFTSYYTYPSEISLMRFDFRHFHELKLWGICVKTTDVSNFLSIARKTQFYDWRVLRWCQFRE